VAALSRSGSRRVCQLRSCEPCRSLEADPQTGGTQRQSGNGLAASCPASRPRVPPANRTRTRGTTDRSRLRAPARARAGSRFRVSRRLVRALAGRVPSPVSSRPERCRASQILPATVRGKPDRVDRARAALVYYYLPCSSTRHHAPPLSRCSGSRRRILNRMGRTTLSVSRGRSLARRGPTCVDVPTLDPPGPRMEIGTLPKTGKLRPGSGPRREDCSLRPVVLVGIRSCWLL
jgi:hypothetical protein